MGTGGILREKADGKRSRIQIKATLSMKKGRVEEGFRMICACRLLTI